MRNMRLWLNLLMLSLVLLALANELIENIIHEILGLILCSFIIFHNLLNKRWYAKIFKSKNLLNSSINIVLLIAISTTLISGIVTSEDLFVFLHFDSSPTLQRLHVAAAYWFVVLLGIHLGIHFSRFIHPIKNITPFSLHVKHLYLKWGLLLSTLLFGIYASDERNIGNKLLMKEAFDFWNFKDNTSGFFLYSLSIIVLYAITSSMLINIYKNTLKKGTL